MNSYRKVVIKDDKYLIIHVVETIASERQIVSVDDTVFKVLATDAYRNIKVSDGSRVFICHNPFSNYFGKIEDSRPKRQIIAICDGFDKVLDMTNAIFDLSPEVMGNLHNDVYLKRQNNEFWIELN